MTTQDFSNNPHMVEVVRTYIAKRKAEAVLADARTEWIDAMIAAQEAGTSLADISRATGVTSPNVTNTIKAAKQKRGLL